jgi:hypothetical protein
MARKSSKAKKKTKAKTARATKTVRKKKKAAASRAANKTPRPKRRKVKNGPRSALALGVQSNRAILHDVLGYPYPDGTELNDIGYGNPPARLGLSMRIRARGVPVDPARISVAVTVGAVRAHMNAVKPAWAP